MAFGRVARLDGDRPGWYLTGVVVRLQSRRLGIAAELTRRRLAWIADRAPEAHYFVNALNAASIALHAGFGFVEVERLASGALPGIDFEGGEGVLYRAKLG